MPDLQAAAKPLGRRAIVQRTIFTITPKPTRTRGAVEVASV
jgi:hypothetical protein